MEELIDTINKLQEVFALSGQHSDINLPQVVVVGTQSSGKSSVLEHIVGKSFLPRGAGIVTRCPLILQLRKSKGEEYAVFQHNPTHYTDYSLICQEIMEHTDQLAGSNKGICNTPIILKIFSHSHQDLTLVDLPGLTKVPVGDQPQDIDEQIKNLILEYVNNPSSIILAVIPANTDMTTSESLKISRDVDPKGERTLAIITKLDIMDKGTDANEMLNGKIIPVKLGIIGVVNRSQKDINEGKSIEDSLRDEATFFKKRYRELALKHGTAYLCKTIQHILISHIKTCLPDLKENITQQLADKQMELMIIDDDNLDQRTKLVNLITKFSHNLSSIIKGDSVNINTSELYGGARINCIFQSTFKKALNDIDPLSGLDERAIIRAIQNSSGLSTALFAPQLAFELLVKKQMKMLRSPCIVSIDLVLKELFKMKQDSLDDQELGLKNYPRLYQELSAIVRNLLKERISVTKEEVNKFIDVQLSYVNIAHPEFAPTEYLLEDIKKQCISLINIQSFQKFTTSNINLDSNTFNNYKLMEQLICKYFNIIKNLLQDTVPKMIMHFLVIYLMDHLHDRLMRGLNDCEAKAKEYLEELPETTIKRIKLKKAITTLEEANRILNSLHYPHTPG